MKTTDAHIHTLQIIAEEQSLQEREYRTDRYKELELPRPRYSPNYHGKTLPSSALTTLVERDEEHSDCTTSCGFLPQQITQVSPVDVIPRWPLAAIVDIIEPEIAPFDPPTPKTLA